MTQLLMHLVHELGNGRAVANAARERHEMRLLDARLDALERRHAPAVPIAA